MTGKIIRLYGAAQDLDMPQDFGENVRLCLGCLKYRGATSDGPMCDVCRTSRAARGALPCRTMLKRRYWVGNPLEKPGDFGLAYLAWDTLLDAPAVVQEYLPRDFAFRDEGYLAVNLRSLDDREIFRSGLQAFVEEAEIFARFDHSHIARVYDRFEANGTAYLTMERLQGEFLEEWLARQPGRRVSPARALEILAPALDALERMHARGFLHRDINPRTLLMTRRGCAVTPNFGASRLAIGERDHGRIDARYAEYAPYEQYHSRSQGPWTDVYGCAAVIYRTVAGAPPAPVKARAAEDDGDRRRGIAEALDGAPGNFVRALSQALDINPRLRPHSVEVFRAMLSSAPRRAAVADVFSHRAEDFPLRPQTCMTHPFEERERTRAAKGTVRVPRIFPGDDAGPEDEKRQSAALILAFLLAATVVSALYFALDLPEAGIPQRHIGAIRGQAGAFTRLLP